MPRKMVPNPDGDQGNDQEAEGLKPIDGKPQRAFNAYIPVLVMVFGMLIGLYVTGKEAVADMADPTLQDIIGNANSYTALMWASLASMMTAALLSLGQRIMGLEEVVNAWFHGVRSMLMAMIILILAWSLGEVTDILKTADFLVSVLGDSLPVFHPAHHGLFTGGSHRFATGSSWGAMGILFPLAMPLTWAVMVSQGQAGPEHMHILYSSVSAILAGAVWGDHCSPISDTTILSSLASGCDHIEHVRTQLPYAMTVGGGVAILLGSIMTALGSPWWIGMSLGLLVLWLILKVLRQAIVRTTSWLMNSTGLRSPLRARFDSGSSNWTGLHGSSTALALLSAARAYDGIVLVVTRSSHQSHLLEQDIRLFSDGSAGIAFP